MPGLPELLIILVICLVVFGANKLPGIGDALGRSIKNFKRASKVDELEDKDDDDKDEPKKALAAGKAQKQLEPAGETADAEWEEVVVRRRKKPVGAKE